MIPAPKGWKAAYVTFFGLLAVFIPALSAWSRRAQGALPESAKIAVVILVVAGAAGAALLVRRLLR